MLTGLYFYSFLPSFLYLNFVTSPQQFEVRNDHQISFVGREEMLQTFENAFGLCGHRGMALVVTMRKESFAVVYNGKHKRYYLRDSHVRRQYEFSDLVRNS